MSRPLRIEFAGAVYHVTSRGDRREAIYRDDADRLVHLAVVAQAMDRFDAQVLAYCLMGNHYHLVLHTRQANLSRLMRHLNGVYTQDFNRRHRLAGHLFQGRFKAVIVDRDAYLLALCRYVERNPVAAGLVATAPQWPWSSYRAHVGEAPTPHWLDSEGLYGYLLGRPLANGRDRRLAARRYAALVSQADEGDASFWQTSLRAQVFLGDEAFVARMQALPEAQGATAKEIPKAQRHRPCHWQDCLAQCGGDRSRALHMAYRDCGATMTALAQQARLSVAHVSRLIAAQEKSGVLLGEEVK